MFSVYVASEWVATIWFRSGPEFERDIGAGKIAPLAVYPRVRKHVPMTTRWFPRAVYPPFFKFWFVLASPENRFLFFRHNLRNDFNKLTVIKLKDWSRLVWTSLINNGWTSRERRKNLFWRILFIYTWIKIFSRLKRVFSLFFLVYLNLYIMSQVNWWSNLLLSSLSGNIALFLKFNCYSILLTISSTSFTKLPRLHGREVDLYLLYSLVTSRGGWEKVRRLLINI